MMKNDNYDRVRMLSFADLGDERGSLIGGGRAAGAL